MHCVKRFLRFIAQRTHYVDPVNFQPLEASPEALQRDLEYSLSSSNVYLENLPGGRESLQGKKVLEIGPGINFGLSLILACHGAEVMVVDRFLIPWDPDYHPKFYALLRDRLKRDRPQLDLTPLDIIVSQGGYAPESLSLYSCSLEELAALPDQFVDIVLSCAVLEHLYDLASAFAHLARITKPAGLGLHQVDFRDHRDFSRPLEFLLLSDKRFFREFTKHHGECGNRFRPQEMKKLLDLSGFHVKEFQPNGFTEEKYLAEFTRRLRKARKSRYRDYPAEDLRCVGAFFILEKV